jgi:hypothetical protein
MRKRENAKKKRSEKKQPSMIFHNRREKAESCSRAKK